MRRSVYLSVVIPAYNEELRLPKTLERLDAYLNRQNYDSEVIVVDDGSCDRTNLLAGQFQFGPQVYLQVLSNVKNLGKGASIRRGMAAARGRFILFTDADLSTPISEVENLFREVQTGADIVIGTRLCNGKRELTPQPWYRVFMGRTFNWLVQRLLLPGFYDTQCGFKLFRSQVAHRLFKHVETPRFGFDAEILYLAQKAGIRIAEVPVEWHNSGASTVFIIKDSMTMFLDLFRIRWRHWDTHI